MRFKKLSQRGVTLIELMIATAIMATMASTVVVARNLMAKQTVVTDDRAFATQKALQMFGELKSLVSGSESDVRVLDDYDNGSVYDKILTTDKSIDTATGDPGNALSGNRKSNGNWRFMRQVNVVPLVNDSSARLVTVKVWRYAGDTNPNSAGDLLSEVSGILRSQSNGDNPTQVLDIYFLDINNIQGWWAQVPSLLSNIKQAISDVESASNDTLTIRPHFITRTSYGRDQQYRPFINEATSTTSTASSWVYLYPGLTQQDDGSVTYFYQPDDSASGVVQDGNFNIDGSLNTPVGPDNLPDYSVADQYNHAVRYPDEVGIYKAVTAAYAAAGDTTQENPVTEISERMLMEEMLSEPQSFENAMVVNLHGELLPLPPMRNYSDAAKDPVNLPDYRVVTHPENIYYPVASGSTTVNLRVYGYMDGFDSASQINNYPATNVASMPFATVSITLPGIYYTSSQISSLKATAIYGDAQDNYTASPVTSGATVGLAGMAMTVESNDNVFTNSYGDAVTGQTTILLFKTPFRCPQAAGSGNNGSGLNAADMLYGLEYIPCSPDETTWSTTFTGEGLTATSSKTTSTAGNPKNTACWILSLPMTVEGPNSPQEIDTQLLTPNLGAPNLSKSYVWVGNNDPPPYTERYQYMGDPRDCPYLDVKVGGPTGSPILPYSYNWYFKDITNGATGVDGYKGFMNTNAGWGYTSDGINIPVDIPRFYQTLRNGLFATTSIYCTVNGWSFYYYGLGGEIGYDQIPYSYGIQYKQAPWATSISASNAVTGTDEIITETWASASTKYARIPASLKHGAIAQDSWYAKPWLGELYPDSQYNTFWSPYGNLPTLANTTTNSTDPVTFFREDYANISTGSNSLNGFHGSGNHFGKATGEEGGPSFYNGSSDSALFHHEGAPDAAIGSIYSLGVSCYSIFGYSLASQVGCTRPWSIDRADYGANTPTEWSVGGTNGYSAKNALTIPMIGSSGVSDLFFDSDQGDDWNGSGVVQVTSPSSPASVFYTIESGLATSANVGTNTLGTYALIFTLRTFLDGGMLANPGYPGHIAQVPLIQVSVDSLTNQYDDPSSIGVTIASPVLDVNNHPVTDMWYRFPGLTSTTGNFYTELYAGYNNLLNSTYTEMTGSNPVTLLYNLKYSSDGGSTWKYMQDNQAALSGALGTGPNEAITETDCEPVTYSWDVSDSTTFPQGSYLIQGEAYREGYGLHYAMHDLSIFIDR